MFDFNGLALERNGIDPDKKSGDRYHSPARKRAGAYVKEPAHWEREDAGKDPRIASQLSVAIRRVEFQLAGR